MRTEISLRRAIRNGTEVPSVPQANLYFLPGCSPGCIRRLESQDCLVGKPVCESRKIRFCRIKLERINAGFARLPLAGACKPELTKTRSAKTLRRANRESYSGNRWNRGARFFRRSAGADQARQEIERLRPRRRCRGPRQGHLPGKMLRVSL